MIHNLCMYFFPSFFKLAVALPVTYFQLLSVFSTSFHTRFRICVPAVQPYHSEPGGEGEKKELSYV